MQVLLRKMNGYRQPRHVSYEVRNYVEEYLGDAVSYLDDAGSYIDDDVDGLKYPHLKHP